MKSGAVTVFALALIGGGALTAVAQEPCGAGCGMQMKACIATARMTNKECRMTCRASSSGADLGACLTSCKDTLRSNTATCRSGVPDCLASCQTTSPDVPTGCNGACGQDLGTCVQDVVTTAKACARGCSDEADRVSCLQGCVSAAQDGAAGCARTFASCLAGCGVPVPPPVPCFLSGPACGGQCPDGLTCTSMPAGRLLSCACRPSGGSPSGAFLN
jgi:hypothetical protein